MFRWIAWEQTLNTWIERVGKKTKVLRPSRDFQTFPTLCKSMFLAGEIESIIHECKFDENIWADVWELVVWYIVLENEVPDPIDLKPIFCWDLLMGSCRHPFRLLGRCSLVHQSFRSHGGTGRTSQESTKTTKARGSLWTCMASAPQLHLLIIRLSIYLWEY